MLMDFMLFGKEYKEVHEWIDSESFKNLGYFHWLDKHHIEAISSQYKVDSPEYLSAYMHILSDWLSHWRQPFIPVNRKDVIVKLTFIGYIQEGDFVE